MCCGTVQPFVRRIVCAITSAGFDKYLFMAVGMRVLGGACRGKQVPRVVRVLGGALRKITGLFEIFTLLNVTLPFTTCVQHDCQVEVETSSHGTC
eukprot:g63018.t1